MITSWQVSPGTSRPCHSDERAEEAGVRVLDELLGELGQLRVALGERGQVRQARRAPPRPRSRRRAGRRRGPSVRPSSGVDELADLVELGLAEAVAAGRRQVAGDVEDGLLAVVERRADVDALPRQRVVGVGGGDRWPTRSVGLRPSEVATAPKSPPSISVALVKTTVLSVSSLSRIGPHTCSGATWSRAGMRSRASLEPQHVGLGAGGHPLGVDEDLLHHALGLGAAGVGLAVAAGLAREGRQAGAGGVAHQRPGRRRAAAGTWSMRPGGVASIASASCSAASSRSPAGSPSTVGASARPAGGPLDVGHAELVGGRLGDPGGRARGPRR